MLRIPFAVVAILLTAGCYYYQPVDTPTPARRDTEAAPGA